MNFAKHWAAGLDDYVIDLAWSPDGALLAVASAAGGITLCAAATGAVQHVLPGHENGTNCLAWAPALNSQPSTLNPPLLASGGQDGFVRFWDAATGRQTAEVKLGNAWVEHLVWRPVTDSQLSTLLPDDGQDKSRAGSSQQRDNPQLLFASAGRKLVALQADGSVAHTFPDAPKTISALAISPGPALGAQAPVLAAAYFGGVCLWHGETFAADKELPYNNAILALTWSPDNRWLVAGCHDQSVHLWIPAEDQEFHMSGYETKLQELSFSRDSKWLATGGGRDACVWDCAGAGPEGREPLLLPHQARTCAVAFQNDHGLLATASADGEFCLWAPTRKNPLVAEVKMPAAATKFAWRPDDSLLAVGTEKGTVYVFKTD
jgi:WD40 repeat protein